MPIPSGNESEVLKRTYITALNSLTAFRWDGTAATVGTTTYEVPTDHIITVLNVVISDMSGVADTFNMYVQDGSVDLFLLKDEATGVNDTFVWNDRFVLSAGDKLLVTAGGGANYDFYLSYIDQNWDAS